MHRYRASFPLRYTETDPDPDSESLPESPRSGTTTNLDASREHSLPTYQKAPRVFRSLTDCCLNLLLSIKSCSN